MRGSPKGASKSGGMDFEMEGRQEEVQKERARVADWTLKRREAGGSPKGASKSGGLDFEAEGRCEKVQNASRRTRAEDQTSHLCKNLYKIP